MVSFCGDLCDFALCLYPGNEEHSLLRQVWGEGDLLRKDKKWQGEWGSPGGEYMQRDYFGT